MSNFDFFFFLRESIPTSTEKKNLGGGLLCSYRNEELGPDHHRTLVIRSDVLRSGVYVLVEYHIQTL